MHDTPAAGGPLSSRYVDGSYLAANEDWHEGDSPWKAARIREILARNEVNPKSICEVGCGAGGVLKALEGAFPASTLDGFDISPQAIGIARRKETDRLKFHQRDLLDEPDRRFDLVVAADVFEHVPDYLGFLAKLRARGDRFVFHIPLDLSALWVMCEFQILRRRRTVGHIHHFTKATALATLEDTGYAIDDWRFTESCYVDPRSLKTRISEIPVRLLSKTAPTWAANFFGGFSLLVLAS